MTNHRGKGEATETDSLELDIQRLIDGELVAKGRRTLLTQAEARPAIWRRIALQFIEEQSLQANRSVFADCAPPRAGNSDGALVPDDAIRTQPTDSHRRPLWAVLASLAVCLLIGVSIGRFISPLPSFVSESVRPVAPDRQTAAAEQSPIPKPSLGTNLAVPATIGSETTTRLVGLNKTGQSVVDLPIVPVRSLSSEVLMGHDHASLDDLHRELARRGIELRYQTTVVDGKLPNGRQMYLPVHEVTLRNVGY